MVLVVFAVIFHITIGRMLPADLCALFSGAFSSLEAMITRSGNSQDRCVERESGAKQRSA